MTISTRAVGVLALPLLAVLASTSGAAVAAPVPTSAPKSKAQLGDGMSSAITAMMSSQSIYIPCYAFTPLLPGPREDWNPGRASCYLLKKNASLLLAAPLHLPATEGKLRIKKLRCYANSGTAGDRIEYNASLMSKNQTLASMAVVQKREEDPESVASPAAGQNLDPLTQHYDISISWRVEVADGDGWLPQDNVFRGCRVDYSIENT